MLLALADAFLEGGLSVFGGCYERVISVATEQEEPNATKQAAGNEVLGAVGGVFGRGRGRGLGILMQRCCGYGGIS